MMKLADNIHKVTIVDDSDTIRRSFKLVLEHAGYGVEDFPSGQEFLKCRKQSMADCVVLDLEMPDMNGIDVLTKLRELDTTTPVLIVTGTQDAVLLEVAQNSDISAVLKKPIGPDVLLAAVAEAVQEASSGS